MSTDKYLDKEYHFSSYNCSHFVNDVWFDLTGESIIGICQSFIQGRQRDFITRIRERVRLDKPVSPCVVLMHNSQYVPHAGIYIDGDVLHLTETGVKRETIDRWKALGKLSFYK